MNLFDVYPLYDIEPVSAKDCLVTDANGNEYLDFYGGHAVISIGHTHPKYVNAISEQLTKIGFYSNAVQNSLQVKFAEKLGEISGYPDYSLFLCNSGAEANENALKLASFITGKRKIISFKKSFHGRTSAAVAITDNEKIVAPLNDTHARVILPLNNIEAIKNELSEGDVAAVIIEGILGIGGIVIPDDDFMVALSSECKKFGVLLILDEIQSGYGRSGKFFAHQYNEIKPDIITVAKGMGNGFPLVGVIISPELKPWHGMLGTTFGGNHLACAAGLAVLDVIEEEMLVNNAFQTGKYIIDALKNISGVDYVRGRGLMIGIEISSGIKEIRKELLFKHRIFTGVSGNNIIRLLPPLTATKEMGAKFLEAIKSTL